MERRLSEFYARDSEHWTVVLLLALAGAIGLATILGGAKRWAAQAYQTAAQVPGAPESWGVALLLCSIVGVFAYASSKPWRGARTLFVIAMFGAGLWYLFFGLAFLDQAVASENVSYNGAILNFALMLAHIQRAVTYWNGARD